jgi:hypothetical protein
MAHECRSALKANRNSHLWSVYHRRPRETTYLRSVLDGDFVGLVCVLGSSGSTTTRGRFGSIGGLGKADRVTCSKRMKLNLG